MKHLRCDLCLKTIPLAFANYVGGSIMSVKKKGESNWLDGIIIPTRTFEEKLDLLHETFDCLWQSKLSVNLPNRSYFSRWSSDWG